MTPQGEIPIWSPLLGRVNVYNLIAASAAAYARDVEPQRHRRSGLTSSTASPAASSASMLGQPFTVIVDYAHTDDALRNLTAVARDFLAQRGGHGPGDHGLRLRRRSRPQQASADGRGGGSGSDFVVLTSDNPRSENPLDIMNDALPGLQRSGTKYTLEPDRRKAIALAIDEAQRRRHRADRRQRHEKVQVTSARARCRSTTSRWRAKAAARRIRGAATAQAANVMKLPLARAAEFMPATGELRSAKPSPAGYSIDSRTLQPGDLFFAVRGERLDGHDFVEAALGQRRGRRGRRNRAGSALSRRKSRLLVVEDSLLALAATGRGGAPAMGKAADRRDRLGRQDHHQGNHRARAGDAASRAEVAGQSEQPFRHAAAAAEARARARDCGHRDGHVARRRDHATWPSWRSRTAAW